MEKTMGLVRWEPFQELEEMTQQLNRLMNAYPRRRQSMEESLTAGDWAPLVDIRETEKEYLFKAEIPEVKKDDVKVEIEDGTLRIAGERREEKEDKDVRYHRVERSYGTFTRSFTLPADADPARVQADFKDGVLTVHVAKSETARPKTVSVKVA
jgi:HSP20 family protein